MSLRRKSRESAILLFVGPQRGSDDESDAGLAELGIPFLTQPPAAREPRMRSERSNDAASVEARLAARELEAMLLCDDVAIPRAPAVPAADPPVAVIPAPLPPHAKAEPPPPNPEPPPAQPEPSPPPPVMREPAPTPPADTKPALAEAKATTNPRFPPPAPSDAPSVVEEPKGVAAAPRAEVARVRTPPRAVAPSQLDPEERAAIVRAAVMQVRSDASAATVAPPVPTPVVEREASPPIVPLRSLKQTIPINLVVQRAAQPEPSPNVEPPAPVAPPPPDAVAPPPPNPRAALTVKIPRNVSRKDIDAAVARARRDVGAETTTDDRRRRARTMIVLAVAAVLLLSTVVAIKALLWPRGGVDAPPASAEATTLPPPSALSPPPLAAAAPIVRDAARER